MAAGKLCVCSFHCNEQIVSIWRTTAWTQFNEFAISQLAQRLTCAFFFIYIATKIRNSVCDQESSRFDYFSVIWDVFFDKTISEVFRTIFFIFVLVVGLCAFRVRCNKRNTNSTSSNHNIIIDFDIISSSRMIMMKMSKQIPSILHFRWLRSSIASYSRATKIKMHF